MKPSKELSSGLLHGLRAPFSFWSEVRRSMNVDLTPRYRNTLSEAWLETGRLLREAERIEGLRIEQAAPTISTSRKSKEGAGSSQRLCA